MKILGVNEIRLAELGQRVNDQGVGAVAGELGTLADIAACYGVAPGASAALVDPTSPDVVRERAFAVTALAVLRAARSEADGTTTTPGSESGTGRVATLAPCFPVEPIAVPA